MPMISLRLSDDELAAIDHVRGKQPRGAWIKELCVAVTSTALPGTDQGVSGAGQPGLSDGAAGVSGDRGAETGQPPRSVEAAPQAPVKEPWHVRASQDRDRDIAAQKGGGG